MHYAHVTTLPVDFITHEYLHNFTNILKTLLIFGSSVTENVENQTILCFPTSPVYSLCITLRNRKPRKQRMVHCACNRVQLLQRSRLHLSWTMPPTTMSWMHWLQDLGSHTAKWLSVVRQKDWRNQTAGWIQTVHSYTAFEWKCDFRFSCFPVLPGSAEAQAIWGGIVKGLLIAYFIGNISAKNIKIPSRVSKL